MGDKLNRHPVMSLDAPQVPQQQEPYSTYFFVSIKKEPPFFAHKEIQTSFDCFLRRYYPDQVMGQVLPFSAV